jgi:hypothetical protein
MHTTYIELVPTDPDFVPAAERFELAKPIFFAALPGACSFAFGEYFPEMRDTQIWPTVQLHAGINASKASCPNCHSSLTFQWLVDECTRRGVLQSSADLEATAPCCGKPLRLYELDYPAPAVRNLFTVGFGKFSFMAATEFFSDRIPLDAWAHVEELVGCKLRTLIVQF